jgi:hypothetical protein
MRLHAWNTKASLGLLGARSIRRSIPLNSGISVCVTGRHAPGCPCGLPGHLQAGGPWVGNGAIRRRLAAVRTVYMLAGACTSRAVGTALEAFSWKKARTGPGGLDLLQATRRSSATVSRSYVSVTDQVALEAQSLHQLPGPRVRSETAPGLDNLVNTLPFGAGHPEVTSPLLRQVARRHVDQDAFSTLPVRESPRQS